MPSGRVAVAVHDPVAQRAVVRADPHRAAELLAALDEGRERLVEPLQLADVVRVAVVAHGEPLLVRIVARVDADLLDVLDGLHGRLGQEVDVGDEGDGAPTRGREARADVLQAPGGLDVGRRHPDDLAAHLGERDRLADGRGDVLRVAGRHRLDADRVRAADADAADQDLARPSADRLESGGAVGHARGQGLAAAGAAGAAACARASAASRLQRRTSKMLM
jgi:hypothetical protein